MKYIPTIALLLLCTSLYSQQVSNQGWHLKDKDAAGVYGISLDKAYVFLQEKQLKSTPVIVAILDDGIDTLHEELRQVLWVNTKEIAGNKKDDDGNGYVDDLHGWNFLGNASGRNVTVNSSEWIRVYWRYKAMYESKVIDTTAMQPMQKYQYAMWQKARSGVVGKGMKEDELKNLQQFLANAIFCDSILKPLIGRQEYTAAQLEAFQPVSKAEKEMREFFITLFKQVNIPDATNTFALDELQKYVTGELRRASGDKIPPEDSRQEITLDDATQMSNRFYGNNDITNGELMHGTHLAGIVAASRSNGLGIKGIAGNVKIMMIRTSADGDEVDKDIASGIRYAVDNGARIINMSFGKSLSPDKQFIDDAVRYALSRDVLIVQAAGNSKRDIDKYDNYPNRQYLLTDSLAPNWITVAASDTFGNAAAFSNYGEQVVDVFAPGVAIYSTVPGDKYMSWDGTSMAAPVVSGITALLRSYFPDLSAIEIKKILSQSVVTPAAETFKPGTTEKVTLRKLCTTGGIVNAFNAVTLALKQQNQ